MRRVACRLPGGRTLFSAHDSAELLYFLRTGRLAVVRQTEGGQREAGAAGLDVPRFELDIRSNAILEAFGAHLEEARAIPDRAKAENATGCTGPIERVTFPSFTFIGADGERHGVYGWQRYELYVEAAAAAGVTPSGVDPPDPLEVIDRFGRCATREIEEICQRPRVVVEAELWALAKEWKLKPVMALTGTLWEMA